jgi:hypothetical protein
LAFEKFLESQGKGQLEPSLSSELKLWTPNEAFFSLKSISFWLWQTNWADKFWGIFGNYSLYK